MVGRRHHYRLQKEYTEVIKVRLGVVITLFIVSISRVSEDFVKKEYLSKVGEVLYKRKLNMI